MPILSHIFLDGFIPYFPGIVHEADKESMRLDRDLNVRWRQADDQPVAPKPRSLVAAGILGRPCQVTRRASEGQRLGSSLPNIFHAHQSNRQPLEIGLGRATLYLMKERALEADFRLMHPFGTRLNNWPTRMPAV